MQHNIQSNASLQKTQSQKLNPNLSNSSYLALLLPKNHSEPRFVNAAQYRRIMVMRIKRARKQIQQQQPRDFQNHKIIDYPKIDKKYKYESRHIHAKNRVRGPDGKFIKHGQEDK